MSSFTKGSGVNKRSASSSSSPASPRDSKSKRKQSPSNGKVITSADGVTPIDELVFEDPYEDEWGSSSDDEEQKAANEALTNGTSFSKAAPSINNSSISSPSSSSSSSSSTTMSTTNTAAEDEDLTMGGTSTEEQNPSPAIWRGNIDDLPEGETLDFDESTYITHHAMRTQWPCLSFDIVRDKLGSGRTKFPMTAYMVAGTQADQPNKNEVLVMKVGDLHKTMREQDDDDNDDDDDDLDDDPYLLTQSIPHVGGVNRIRSMPQAPHIVAAWSETSDVHVYDISSQLAMLDASSGATGGGGGGGGGSSGNNGKSPVYTYTGHPEEGFAMAWSSVKAGRMATGDCSSRLHVWDVVTNTTTWSVNASPYIGHTSSVEDIQWSNTEENVFASCSSDCSVKIFDVRRNSNSMLSIEDAHTQDVNVISWNPIVGFLLASGSDDGGFKIWDLRKFQKESPVAHFQFHRAPITSIEWSGSEDSVLATSSSDHTCIVWDMSLEVSNCFFVVVVVVVVVVVESVIILCIL
jgi:ribosome assembly protein RRB1